ncbi:MAG: penicillin acylase family protein [Ferruginibacter sp.]
MRIFAFLLSAIATVALIVILNSKLVLPAPLGKILAPQSGVWQNAEKENENFSGELHFPNLKGNTSVYLDDRLVPHVFADNETDAMFVQGFLHAKFRLWQMDLQTLSAAGEVSKVVGEVALNHDREFRRLGMVYAAENALREIEADAEMKAVCDAYTAGVNAYINTLTESTLPIEYKLMGYKPTAWSNLRTSLFLKYMSYDLASHERDFEMATAHNYFDSTDFNLLYPVRQDSADPIIPKGTLFPDPAIKTASPPAVDSLYLHGEVTAMEYEKADEANGSNNWAVNGSKTKSGAPILCNDPHLGLNLPSLWYEMQLSTPLYNAYGATFPGAPSVIIGFNDSCAFGFTNGGRDVRDYYEIQFKDESRKEYRFNNEWKQTSFRIEKIEIAGKPAFYDTVAYTLFGPVMYDKSFGGKRKTSNKNYAVRWKAHDASKELKIFYYLNRAKNYNDYVDACTNLHTPGQNVVFACKNGDIALRTQGEWPAKWRGQGDFPMPGTDSSYMWQGMIPQNEVPYQYNPERGFVSSANQRPVAPDYPYYLGREYPSARGVIINRLLGGMLQVTPQDMMALQTNNYNVFAEMALPLLLRNIKVDLLSGEEQKYFAMLRNWDLKNDPSSTGATVFSICWAKLRESIFTDEFAKAPEGAMKPFESTLMEALLRDSAYKFIDDIATTEKETLPDVVTKAFKAASVDIKKAEAEKKLEWAKYKDTRVEHLTKVMTPFSRLHLPIGGGEHVINAAKPNHGPSWRMVVSLTQKTEAYGIYPGGQSGNPGSRFYDNAIDKWAKGEYYSLWMMTKEETGDKRIKWIMNFKKG